MGLNNDRGLTLVEIIVSIAILGIIVAPLSSLFVNTVKNNAMAKDKMTASQLAQKTMEKIMLDIKNNGRSPIDEIPIDDEGDYEIEAFVNAVTTYAVGTTTSGEVELGSPNATIVVSDKNVIEMKAERITKKETILENGVIQGNYLSSDTRVNIEVKTESETDIMVEVINDSDKDLHIYKLYDEEGSAKIVINTSLGEVYSHDNITNDSNVDDENEDKNYVYKITVKVSKKGKELVKLASYKTND